MKPVPSTIVIVGAGFAGTTVACNLLRQRHGQPLRIVLVDRAQMARGVAYSKRRYPYLLNVPAGRMSANPEDPLEFLRFARRWQPAAGAQDFLPRELYGEYLEYSLRTAEDHAARDVELHRTYGQVIAVEKIHRTTAVHVHLADGRQFRADAAVLALGNPPPAPLRGSEELRGSARYLEDPWQAPPSFRAGETVLVVGTGLTMADTVMAGHPGQGSRVLIHAISRHGLLPTPQSSFTSKGDGQDSSPLIRAAACSVLRLLKEVRGLATDVEQRGGDWREAVTTVRELAPDLWARLTIDERRRFLRHVRPYWDIHRHRLPESSCATLKELQCDGQLVVHAGRIVGLELAGKQVRVKVRERGQARTTELLVDRVVNCTGPDYDVAHSRDRLVRSLVSQGLALRDPLGLGLATDEIGTLKNASGYSTSNVYYIGPMLRATHWETTAVTELRERAARLARHLVGAQQDLPHDLWAAESPRSSSGTLARFAQTAGVSSKGISPSS